MEETLQINLKDPNVKILKQFVQAALAVLKYADTHFYRNSRVSLIRFMALQILACHGDAITNAKLAELTYTKPHNITQLIDRMKKEGLVTRERNKKNRRSVNITLTEKGRDVLNQATPTAREIINQVMSSLSEREFLALDKPLSLMEQNAQNAMALSAL